LFLWSGESYVHAKNLGLSSGLTTADVEGLLESISSGHAVSTPFSNVLSTAQPEVLVIFLEPQLSLSQVVSSSAQLPALKKVMQTSTGSFYAPYVDLTEPLVSGVIQSASKIPASASVIYAGKGASLLPVLKIRVPKVKAVPLNTLDKVLSSSKIFNNGVTDLVIVHLEVQEEDTTEKFTRENSIIQAVHTIVSEKTSNYVAVYTALEADIVEDQDYRKRVFMQYEYILDDPNNGTNGTNGTITWFQMFFPGWFWEVTLILIFLIPILITGFCHLMSIQTPMFEERVKAKHA